MLTLKYVQHVRKDRELIKGYRAKRYTRHLQFVKLHFFQSVSNINLQEKKKEKSINIHILLKTIKLKVEKLYPVAIKIRLKRHRGTAVVTPVEWTFKIITHKYPSHVLSLNKREKGMKMKNNG
jgi:hypothetical protein